MERFKICEKETKTKAFSKEGLGQQPKTDPKEKAKSETRDWLNNVVSELESQIDSFEAELEGLSVKKGKTLTHLDTSITRHKDHIIKLELILRLLDNDELSPEQVNDVKDFLDDYVERNQDDFDEFSDVDELYSTLPLDEVEGLEDLVTAGPLVKGTPLSMKSSLAASASQVREIEQTVTPSAVAQQPQQQQQTLTGRFCKCLFSFIFYTQLALISAFVIFLTLRGLVLTKSSTFHPKKWYTPLLSSVALSGILSLVWNCFFTHNIPATVKATLWFTPLLTIIVGSFLMVYDQYSHPWVIPRIGVPLVVCSIIAACYCLGITNKHRFTFKMMSITTGVLPERTRAISVGSTIISVLYSGFIVAGIGGAAATRTRFDILFITIIIISFAWTMQVLKNIQLVAISKATYVYFKRVEFMNACDALRATLSHNLGNVCIGSTLVPLIVLFRATIRCGICGDADEEIHTSTSGCYCIANHIILCGNSYGFVHVGAYNKGFVKASSDTWKRFRTVDGFEKLIDFEITSTICFYRAVGIGSISALTAGIWEHLIEKDHFFELTMYAFIIGYFVGRIGSAWLQACVMGYYVAYSEDPQSDNFDNTIPQRIERQRIEKAQRETQNNRIVLGDDEEEEDITHVSRSS